MDNIELQAARKLLFLSVREAAEMIGEFSVRHWQHLEAGDRTIHEDVKSKMLTLLNLRQELLQNQCAEKVEYFLKFQDFQKKNPRGTEIDWKIQQSVFAQNMARSKKG